MNRASTFSVITLGLMLASNSFCMEVHIVGSTHPEPLRCSSNKRISTHLAPPAKAITTEAIPNEGEINEILTSATQTITTTAPSESTQNSNWLTHKPRRFGLWGDSHAAANIFSDGLIDSLGLKEKRVLPGFIPPTIGNKGVRLPLRSTCLSDGWETKHAYRNNTKGATWSRALTRLSTQKTNAYIWLDFRSKLLENSFNTLDVLLTTPITPVKEADNNDTPVLETKSTRSLIRLSVNDSPEQIVDIDTANDNVLKISAQHPISTVKISLLDGSIGLDGFIPRYNKMPDYFFDTMGIPGATARGLQFLNIKQHSIEPEQPYDFIFIEFGTNEGNNLNFDSIRYSQELRKSLTVFRQNYPDTSCILIGPTDRGIFVSRPKQSKKVCTGKRNHRKCTTKSPVKAKVDILRYARIHATINQLQADIGQEFQCDAWSWQNAMGGSGGIYRWFYNKPTLAQRDLIHLTASGYRLSAQLFAQKLQKKFMDASINVNSPTIIETDTTQAITPTLEQP